MMPSAAKFSFILLIFALAANPILPLQARAEGPNSGLALVKLSIGPAELMAEVTHTTASQYQGLSDRASLPRGRGMVFLAPAPMRLAMTMRRMRFDLDFIFIYKKRVSEIRPQVSHTLGAAALIQPAQAADMVVEAPAGWAALSGVKPGDPVRVTGVMREVKSSTLQRLLRDYK